MHFEDVIHFVDVYVDGWGNGEYRRDSEYRGGGEYREKKKVEGQRDGEDGEVRFL